jgi:hypothetical protein
MLRVLLSKMYTPTKTTQKSKKYSHIFRLKPVAICLYHNFNTMLRIKSFIVTAYYRDIIVCISLFTIDISYNKALLFLNIHMHKSHKTLYTYLKGIAP